MTPFVPCNIISVGKSRQLSAQAENTFMQDVVMNLPNTTNLLKSKVGALDNTLSRVWKRYSKKHDILRRK